MTSVLLLEDEPLIAMALEDDLRFAGFSVTIAMSVEDAVNWLDGNSPDLAIVDVMLSDGPAEDVAARLSQSNIPFVVHTGDLKDMHHDTPFAAGLWVSKPASSSDILDALNKLLADA